MTLKFCFVVLYLIFVKHSAAKQDPLDVKSLVLWLQTLVNLTFSNLFRQSGRKIIVYNFQYPFKGNLKLSF